MIVVAVRIVVRNNATYPIAYSLADLKYKFSAGKILYCTSELQQEVIRFWVNSGLLR